MFGGEEAAELGDVFVDRPEVSRLSAIIPLIMNHFLRIIMTKYYISKSRSRG